jgi:hypothetical protein
VEGVSPARVHVSLGLCLVTHRALSLWCNRFWPNYARVGPRVTIIFVVLEQLRAWLD